jgi:hypothetical protein
MDSQNKKGSEVIAERRFVAALEAAYPWVHWTEPILMHTFDGKKGLGCRICIATSGIKAPDIENLPASLEAHRDHLRKFHHLEIL